MCESLYMCARVNTCVYLSASGRVCPHVCVCVCVCVRVCESMCMPFMVNVCVINRKESAGQSALSCYEWRSTRALHSIRINQLSED